MSESSKRRTSAGRPGNGWDKDNRRVAYSTSQRGPLRGPFPMLNPEQHLPQTAVLPPKGTRNACHRGGPNPDVLPDVSHRRVAQPECGKRRSAVSEPTEGKPSDGIPYTHATLGIAPSSCADEKPWMRSVGVRGEGPVAIYLYNVT